MDPGPKGTTGVSGDWYSKSYVRSRSVSGRELFESQVTPGVSLYYGRVPVSLILSSGRDDIKSPPSPVKTERQMGSVTQR